METPKSQRNRLEVSYKIILKIKRGVGVSGEGEGGGGDTPKSWRKDSLSVL